MKKPIVLLAFPLLASFSCGNHKNALQLQMSEWEATKSKTAIARMIAHDSIDEALSLTMEIEPQKIDDPQIPFIRGVIWSKKNNLDSARSAFQRSSHIYDSIIAIRPNIYDAINKASCVLMLQGEEAYQLQLDSIEKTRAFLDNPIDLSPFRELTINDVLSSFDEDSWTIQTP